MSAYRWVVFICDRTCEVFLELCLLPRSVQERIQLPDGIVCATCHELQSTQERVNKSACPSTSHSMLYTECKHSIRHSTFKQHESDRGTKQAATRAPQAISSRAQRLRKMSFICTYTAHSTWVIKRSSIRCSCPLKAQDTTAQSNRGFCIPGGTVQRWRLSCKMPGACSTVSRST
jgi:hypothetical protein